MDSKPKATRLPKPAHGNDPLFIAIFGRRNSGKSSIINLLTGQDTAIVSETPGTTTDPVRKRVEVSGLGIVTLIDTAGTDDFGELGEKRVEKSADQIKLIDFALLVISENRFDQTEIQIINQFKKWNVPFLMVYNKDDIDSISPETEKSVNSFNSGEIISINTKEEQNRHKLIDAIKEQFISKPKKELNLFEGLVKPKDFVLLVTPIDRQAPKGRLILPQNQSIRSLLDLRCLTSIIQETELQEFLELGIKPALVVCDSTVFSEVSQILPTDAPLTSFSILFSYHKGDFENFFEGTPKISELKQDDHILILESCTHQTSCDDIGRVKLPKMLETFTGKNFNFTTISGLSELPPDISRFSMVIQCGGCMVTRRQLLNRMQVFVEANIPISNYGMAIAYMNGIFERSTEPFLKLLQ